MQKMPATFVGLLTIVTWSFAALLVLKSGEVPPFQPQR